MIRCLECGLRLAESRPLCPTHGPYAPYATSSRPPPRISEVPRRLSEIPPAFGLEDYELKGLLGRGGFGVVYRARRQSDGLGVAIKVASHEQRGAAERLAMEAEALIAIGPPFVPVVYDRGQQGEYPYFVMELVRATTLAERLVEQAGPMPIARFEASARAILDAVEGIHQHGYVHRDLKPENIFLDDEPRARLIDFGEARKAAPSEAFESIDVAAMGTPEYMAPEQCEARSELDVRTDIYALGIVFYEMLAGAPPFWGNAGDVREAQISRRPPQLTSRTSIASAVNAVVLRCLAKDPGQRFECVSALRNALAEALTSAQGAESGWVVARPAPTSSPLAPRKLAAGQPQSRPNKEKRTVGLLFFESEADVIQVTQALAAVGGQLAQANDPQYVGVFGHDVTDNPARGALLAAQRLLDLKLCKRVLLEVAQVSVQVRPNGERRFLSALFSRKERYPLASDPAGILMTQAAAEVLATVPIRALPDRPGILCVDLSDSSGDVTTFGTHGETLVGRESLVDSIVQSVLRAGQASTPSVITVIGEAGHGKSLFGSTVTQKLQQLAPEARVLKLTGQESLGGAAYPTLRDLLRQTLAVPATAPADYGEAFLVERIGSSLGPHVWAAAALVLDWVPPDHPQIRQLSAAPGALRAAASRAAGEALRQSALSQPIAVVLDDAHLADEAALDALEYATLKESRARICVCALTRPGLESARPTWGNRAAYSQRLTLLALEPSAAAALARRLLEPVEHVPEAALKKLVERTQGIPRLLVELVRGLRRAGLVRRFERGSGYYLATDELDRLPELPVVQWSAAREIEVLPAQLTAHARLASALGGKFTVAELEGVLQILERDGIFAETQLDAAIGVQRLIATGLLNRGPLGQIDFRHAFLRETLYDGLPEELRKQIHRAAFEMYRDAAALAEEERLPRLALHAARSGSREEAASTYLVLAERAQQRHAYLDAELMYAHCLENLDQSECQRISIAAQGRGLMRFRLSRLEDALKDFAIAREHAERLESVDREIDLLLDEAMVLDWIGEYSRSGELTRAAESRIGSSSSKLLQARLLMALGRTAERAGQFEESIAKNKQAALEAERLGDAGYETLVIALLLAATDCGQLGRLDEAEALFGAAIRAAEPRGDWMHMAAILNNRGVVWNVRRDADNMARDLHRVRDIARETAFPPLEYHSEVNLSEVYYCVGEVEPARRHAERARAIGRQLWGDAWQTFHAEVLLARLALYTKDAPRARALLEGVRQRTVSSEERKEAKLLPSDELLADMLDLATRSSREEEWSALSERCSALSAAQELIEVLEMQGLCALREGHGERARHALGEALRIAKSSPGLLMNRVSRELEELSAGSRRADI